MHFIISLWLLCSAVSRVEAAKVMGKLWGRRLLQFFEGLSRARTFGSSISSCSELHVP
jgi:hypothetical protein